MAAIDKEQCWSQYYQNKSLSGLRVTYRCNAVKYRSQKQCDASIYVLYHSENSSVSVYRTVAIHKHDEQATDVSLVFKFTPQAQALIAEMFKQKLKPKAMKLMLIENGHGAPPQSKLESYLKKLRISKFGKAKLNLGTLGAWLKNNLTVPESELHPFIVNYEIDHDHDDKFGPRFR